MPQRKLNGCCIAVRAERGKNGERKTSLPDSSPFTSKSPVWAFSLRGVLAVRASNQRNAGVNKGQTATTLPQSCVYRKLDPAISVVKAAENLVWHDGIEALNRAMERGVLVQGCD
jgi:hypothetical protein